MELAEKILNGDYRAIARAVSLIEDRKPEHRELMSRLYPHGGKAHIIGITGSPGAGKSSLVNGLLGEWRRQGKKVAVIAVDPTSPFSGGALLGDRIRMRDHEEDDDVFIRSMGTRGSLGGLSEACQDVVRVMDAAGFDLVIVETVGVGQSELDIMKTADTVVLVLYPSGGDVIQAFKAGIMEIADLFIINKADLPGVEQLKGELEDLIHITERTESWEPPVIQTVSTTKKGMKQVTDKAAAHHDYLFSTGMKTERRLSQKEQEVMRRLSERFFQDINPIIKQTFDQFSGGSGETQLIEEDPYDLAEQIYMIWRQGKSRQRGEG
ncbi:methylmalonyl Co-A mutase-associated GTPase MeaB [Evansella sp. LMS18]|jgi:LAO/AO transport system kinase|uniref:methylmalonyl Co-A mutase-associated GTPase MeaB n=1 Tax=Evansella sp. LMS18 TaxID=2924033 RepID=UPI0020D00F8C|nr:methylmalonyl Co-A mutase-associated GTPase MeaB [Evansella sp. LMS18]UTR12238.1 methylmalonyl Co-A mutase-associated GTPase MeaB [Evansella sp. LMS18]